MIALAEDLARGIDFVRVDLYSTPCGPLVGELTMTPWAGMRRFPDKKFDRLLGKKWKLPKEFDGKRGSPKASTRPFHNQPSRLSAWRVFCSTLYGSLKSPACSYVSSMLPASS
jgi:hypothetical protein